MYFSIKPGLSTPKYANTLPPYFVTLKSSFIDFEAELIFGKWYKTPLQATKSIDSDLNGKFVTEPEINEIFDKGTFFFLNLFLNF